jgi:hypothetical protein
VVETHLGHARSRRVVNRRVLFCGLRENQTT